MAVKKKTGKLLGNEVAAFSLYNEDYEEALRKAKEEFEAKRAANQKVFKEYEKEYNKTLDENYKKLAVDFLDSLNLNTFSPLKDLMRNEENVKALNEKKDFNVLLEKDNELILKVLEFIAKDELIRTTIAEFVEGLDSKKEAEAAEVQPKEEAEIASEPEAVEGEFASSLL